MARTTPRSTESLSTTTAADTKDESIDVGTEGTVTIKPEAARVDEEKMVETLRKTGRYVVERVSTGPFGESARLMIVYYENGQTSELIENFIKVGESVILKAGATETDPKAATSAAQYAGLAEATGAVSQGVQVYPIPPYN